MRIQHHCISFMRKCVKKWVQITFSKLKACLIIGFGSKGLEMEIEMKMEMRVRIELGIFGYIYKGMVKEW